MTKQEARKLIVQCAKSFKRMGFDANAFKEIVEKHNIDDEEFWEAFKLIENEIVHILAVVWGWDR